MEKNPDPQQTEQALLKWFANLNWQLKLALLGVVAVVLLGLYATSGFHFPTGNPGTNPPSAETLQRDSFLLCWWNLENFFDDKVDGWKGKPDKEYDEWFGSNPDMVRLKVKNLTSALLKLNGGIGPDILAVAEVEDSRTADMPGALVLLRDGLNAGIPDPGQHYGNVLWKHMPGGRSIITAILTRLPVDPERTRLLVPRERVLQGVIHVRDHDLIVIAAHWTSRLTDKTGEKRARYGDAIYKHFRALYQENPAVPVLIAGDFNDGPEEPSVVDHLRAIGDREKVLAGGGDPSLFDLLLNPKLGSQGTIASRGKGMDRFDQIVVSPAMLTAGSRSWTVDPDSIDIVTDGTTQKKLGSPLLFPHRFDSPRFPGVRGCSDHLPVIVTLKVP